MIIEKYAFTDLTTRIEYFDDDYNAEYFIIDHFQDKLYIGRKETYGFIFRVPKDPLAEEEWSTYIADNISFGDGFAQVAKYPQDITIFTQEIEILAEKVDMCQFF